MAESPVEKVGGGSLAFRARKEILEAIMEGRFEAGRIPPESLLAEMLGVSRTTVRAALQVLEHDGLIVRTPGRGTVVRIHGDPFALSLQRLIGFSTLLRESGTDPNVEVKWTETSEPPDDAVRRLGLAESESCYLSRKIYRAGGVVALMLQDVVPERSLSGPIDIDRTLPDSLFDFSEEYCREPIERATVELVPNRTNEEIASLFDIERGAPYLMLLETHIARSEQPIAFTRVHVNDKFVRFSITRRH